MAGLEADTSSYNQPLPVSPLETASKVGALQQQQQQIQSGAITIDKQKLDLMNTQFGLMNQELSTMIDTPGITKDQAAQRLTRFATTLKLPPEAVNHMMEELKAAPDVKSFSENALRRGMDTQQRINQQYGTPENQSSGAVQYQGVRDPRTGAFKPATQLPVQPPPGAEYVGKNGQKMGLDPSGPEGVQPVQPVARALPVAPPAETPIVPKPVRTLPVERPVSGPNSPTIDRTPEVPTTLANRMSGAFAKEPPPMFEEGKKTLAENQLRASGLMQNAKPAIQALKIMKTAFPDGKTLATGPGTKQFNDLVATAKAWGVTDTKAENDPTVLRQELEKKLAQFVGTSPIASRSDAAQTLAEASSPNPKTQLLPALINLTRDAVALSRVEAAKALTFKGSDYSKVGEHIANFPQSIDEKAFGLDLMEPTEAKKLIDKMANQYKNGKSAREKNEAAKFKRSLDMADELGFYQ